MSVHAWDDDLVRAFTKVERAGLLDDGLTVADWMALPEDFCRDRELVGGRPVKRERGTPGHQRASRRLANAVEAAAKKAVADGLYLCLSVNQDLDTVLWEAPAVVRRPDVVLYECLEPGQRPLTADRVLLVVEIVSPGSKSDDTGSAGTRSKLVQYAKAGIESYWIVWLTADDQAIARIEEWRLDRPTGAYHRVRDWLRGTDEDAVDTRWPFAIRIGFADLAF